MKLDMQRWSLVPADPRAPTREQWAAMDPAARAQVVAMLPSTPEPLAFSPVGDPHYDAVNAAREALRRWYGRGGGRAYVGADKAVYYPGEAVFSPDVIVVLEVDPGPRHSWIVDHEGRGLDFALEVLDRGSRKKDLKQNVRRYAHLGIPEYFVLDIPRQRLSGWRLSTDGNRYEALVPQHGLFCSETLGLELGHDGDRVRFFSSGAQLPDHDDLIVRLAAAVDQANARAEKETQHAAEQTRRVAEEAKRAEEEAKRAEEEAKRAEEEAKRAEEEAKRADALAERLADLEAAMSRLRGDSE